MWAPGRLDRAVLAGAGGGEPAAEVHVLADLQAVGVKGGAGVVAQGRPGAVEAGRRCGRRAGGPRRPCRRRWR